MADHRAGGEVEHRLKPVRLKQRVQKRAISDVADDQFNTRGNDGIAVAEAQVVEHDHALTGLGEVPDGV